MESVKEDLKAILANHHSDSRKLKAYVVNADGTSTQISGENIYIEIDDERGLLIPLSERQDNEGISIQSLPQGYSRDFRLEPDGEGHLVSPPFKSSSIVMRSGGSNVIYVSPEARETRVMEMDPNFIEDHDE